MIRRSDSPGAPAAAAAAPSERGLTSVYRARSLQSRISSLLALGVTVGLGVCLLAWYYGSVMNRHVRAGNAHTAAAGGAEESSLPPLGRIDAPVAAAPAVAAVPQEPPPAAALPLAAAPARSAADLAMETLAQTPGIFGRQAPAGSPAVPTAAEIALQRRLSGPAFARQTTGPGPGMVAAGSAGADLGGGAALGAGTGADTGADAGPGTGPGTEPRTGVRGQAGGRADDGADAGAGGRGGGAGALDDLLVPSALPAARARALPTQRFLLAKGTFIDCTLETAIDSTLPGMTTCITATDTFSVDGKVVLLERGSKLIGETRGQVQQGSARLFVVWTEARTPSGIVVPLASPGTDPLGRSGLSGEVDRHFWERFGAAILVSVIDGGLQDLQSRGSGTAVYGTGASGDVATEALRGTLGIPPTILKNQGDRIQILVARDLDFRSVYELREAADSR